MTDYERLRRQLNGGIICLISLFALASYEGFALAKRGGAEWWWLFLILLVAGANPTFLGVIYLIRAKRKVLDEVLISPNPQFTSEGN